MHLPFRPLLLVLTLLAGLLVAALDLPGGPARAAAEGVSGETTVYTNTALAGDGVRTPDIISTSANDVVVAWRNGNDSAKYDSGDILYKWSGDGGATWNGPYLLAQSDATYRWHYVIFYKVDTVLYAYLGRAPASANNGMPAEMRAKRSLDSGRTWQDFGVTVNDNGATAVVVAGRPLKYGSTHLIPVWDMVDGSKPRSAVARSTDLVNWTVGGWVPDPNVVYGHEAQLVVSQDDPNKLMMVGRTSYFPADVYNTGPTYAATTTSTDGGLTWTGWVQDSNIPNYQTKGYFTKDLNGQYLAIYNTFGGRFIGPASERPPLFREILHYKTKRPGMPWNAGQFFANGPKITTGDGSGWDTYAMADEYAPGKYFVVWEHDTSQIKVNKLDVSDAFTAVAADWNDFTGWSRSTGGGTVEINPAGQLHLRNAHSTVSQVSHGYAPPAGFVATLRGQVADYSTLDPVSGIGASLAMKVATGTRRLMLAIQSDGVYSMRAGETTWSRVYAVANDTASHLWKVVVDENGLATLYRDTAETGVTWTIQSNTAAPAVQVWTSGTSADPAEARVDSAGVVRDIASNTWDNLTGWTVDAAGGTAEINLAGELHLRNANSGVSTVKKTGPQSCDFTLDFQGQVVNSSTLNTTSGVGASLATKVANGARRLMLSIQSDGVYSMRKGESTWSRVYTYSNAGALASWKVVTTSGGEAKLYRNGSYTGASWTIQDNETTPIVQHWVSGTSTDAAEARIAWTRVTCSPA